MARANKFPKRYKVFSRRNSICDIPISNLDSANWFTDELAGMRYLHVHRIYSEKHGDTIHRVYCRYTMWPRIELREGELFWLIDAPKARKLHHT